MAFKTLKRESNNFSTPQEMFQDNKLKSIKGILDYQSAVINHYLTTISGKSIKNKSVAFELPTGSGKTLVGILIAEFHRRKFDRRCLFLCPTNQLVSQVCSQCEEQYGIEAIPFAGRQADYSTDSKRKYLLKQAIGVTTYSSFFAVNSFFEDPDILIFDDVHSSENYIVDNWSLNITRYDYESLFLQIIALLEDVIGESGMSRLRAEDPYGGDVIDWNDLLPRPRLMSKMKDLEELLRIGTQDSPLRYAWSRIADNLTSSKIQSTYHPEMRAEILFGINNSTDFKNVDDILENIRLFYQRSDDWAAAEADIVERRNQFVTEGENVEQRQIYEKLLASAQTEVDIQYDLWRKDYQSAYEKAIQLVEILNAPILSGYKCFWQYICGCLALEMGNKGKAKHYISQASNNNRGGIRWFQDLLNDINDNNDTAETSEDSYFYDIIESLEDALLTVQNNNTFEQKAKKILDDLLSMDGHVFEQAHLDLGRILGYDAHNSSDSAAPDPYWIINDSLCIVAEDKIYADDSKEISVSHVTQASRHIEWIRENVKTLKRDARIITILVSNSSAIEESARTFGKNVYYVGRKQLHEWAVQAINSLRTARSKFQEPGDANWRAYAHELFSANGTTPKAYIELITKKILSDL